MSAFFVNAVLLIFDVLAGTYILFNEEQPLKAYSSMVFSPLGNITSFRLVQPENIFIGSCVSVLAEKSTLFSDVQFANADEPTSTTFFGILISVRELSP